MPVRAPGPAPRRAALAAVLACAAMAGLAPAAVAATGAPGGGGARGAGPGAATGRGAVVVLRRGRGDAEVPFAVHAAGEVLLAVTVAAPGTDWGVPGDESSVVSLSVDGRYMTDAVIASATTTVREFALGGLAGGAHTLSLRYAGDRSPPRAGVAVLRDLTFTTVGAGDAGYTALRYAPVLFGRNLPRYGGPFANAVTDTPLVAFHEAAPVATAGHTLLTYSVVWSNEDAGTAAPLLMARWGRTTDIEWTYRVEVDRSGRRVPGSDTVQGPSHATTRFTGRYEDGHALIQTCTGNDNVCSTVDDPMRFALSYRRTLPAGAPREAVMDAEPWTYRIAAAEVRREGRTEAVPDPATAALGDERDYLHVSLSVRTGSGRVGVSVGVRLRGDPVLYRSDHAGTGGDASWSIRRDGPVRTGVELPPGTSAADVTEVVAIRVPAGVDTHRPVAVTHLDRAFLLDPSFHPGRSVVTGDATATLTAAHPTAVLWTSAATPG